MTDQTENDLSPGGRSIDGRHFKGHAGPPCPFCAPEKQRVFHETALITCLWDTFPVSDGHALVITNRHAPDWFQATEAERTALMEGVEIARQAIEAHHRPAGYNIGVNVGQAAGQTVPHLHVHVIPRYQGDVHDPRGGVRHVIPGKGNYLRRDHEVRDAEPRQPAVVHGTLEHPLLDAMTADLADASRFDLAVAFVTDSGLDQIEPFLFDFFARQGRLRLLTGDYLDVTEPRALRRMLDWTEEYRDLASVRVFQAGAGHGFHPKAYILHREYAGATAYVGSSNLTQHALRRGIEWNLRLDGLSGEPQLQAIGEAFERLFRHPRTTALAAEEHLAYLTRRSGML